MRVFVALDLPPETMEVIQTWRGDTVRSVPGAGELRWTRPSSCHLTLRYFGDITAGTVERVSGILAEWKPGRLPFSLTVSGTFTRMGEPSIYWLGGDFPDEVTRLAGLLGRIPDQRDRLAKDEFVAHITVARPGRTAGPRELPPPPIIDGILDTISIYDSRLTSEGPVYSTMEKFDITREHRVANGNSNGR